MMMNWKMPSFLYRSRLYRAQPYVYRQGRIQDLAMGGPRFVGKRVTYTSEVSYERSEYKSAGGTGAVSPPRFFLNLEPLRVNLSVI